ncbi:glutamate transporter polyphemus [Drosophila tropicalis]|uniref:glutamate transporter polyphemus n=1 Tax=Drosophila tropicalis TaxID=46794 RepID=UPI0035ABD89B
MAEGSSMYNPYEHREVFAPLSNIDAFISLLKCVIGTGILAMPLAYLYSGMIGGTVLTIITTIVLIHGMHLLILCMVESSRRQEMPYCSFPESMAYAFSVGPSWCRYCSKASGYLVDGVLGIAHYGVTVVYIVFVAENCRQLLAAIHDQNVDLRIFVAVVGFLVLPLFLVRHLKYLVPFNICANILMYVGFIIIIVYLFRGLPALGDRCMFGDPIKLPIYFGIVLFAVTSVGVMLAIESKMKTPENYLGWFGILNLATVFVVITNVVFGVMGYWRYGEDLAASITLNIPTDQLFSQLSKALIAIAIFLSYPLSGYVTIDIIMNRYIGRNRELKHPHIIEYAVRITFVIIGTLNAIAFPNLGPLLALVGAFSISLLNLVFPACMELSLYYREPKGYGIGKWKLWKDIVLILVGIVILSYGSYAAIVQMIDEYGGANKSAKVHERYLNDPLLQIIAETVQSPEANAESLIML